MALRTTYKSIFRTEIVELKQVTISNGGWQGRPQRNVEMGISREAHRALNVRGLKKRVKAARRPDFGEV